MSETENSCDTCDDCNDLLEQSFACLFGYRKPRQKYLENHTVVNIEYTLENCVRVYEHFKLDELPEYDDVQKWSVTPEFNEFLLLVVRLMNERWAQSDDDLIALQNKFMNGLEAEDHAEIEGVIKSLRGGQDLGRFIDIFYMLGDFALKTEKDFERKKSLVMKYLIKDITVNNERYDSWAALALLQSSIVLEEYLEHGFNLGTEEHVDEFCRSVYVTINLFRYSTGLMPKDQKIWVEYGSFLYQIHSYCSRQLKLVSVGIGTITVLKY